MDKIKERARRRLKRPSSPGEPARSRPRSGDSSRSKLETISIPPGSIPRPSMFRVIILCQVVGIILLSLVLAGCSSHSSMTSVYILGVQYVNSTEISSNPLAQNLSVVLSDHKGPSQLEVRAGYFGMCVRQRGIIWICSGDSDSLAEQVGFDNDPLNLIGTMSRFKDGVLFSGILFMSIGIALISIVHLVVFPDLHEKKVNFDSSGGFPSRATMNVVSSCCFASAGLTLVAALWQHVGSVAAAAVADSANYGNVKADIGSAATSMVWAAFAIIGVLTVLIVSMTVNSKIWERHIGRD